MVIIDNFFIYYRRPEQFVYAGESYVDIYKYVGRTYKKTRTLEGISLLNPGDENEGFDTVARELGDLDTGLVLNSGSYIYNIFDFDKIPLWDDMRKEIVEWRLKKVFPENLDDYDHQFFKLSRTKILSILLKNNIKKDIEEMFNRNQRRLTYLGNSTINILNRVAKLRTAPDFFVEIDGGFFMTGFQYRSLPFYFRKFRVENEEEAVAEILKTINYVKNSYSREPHSYSVVAHHSPFDLQRIQLDLAREEVRHIPLKNSESLIFPG